MEYFKNCSYRAIEALNKETKGFIIHEPDPEVLPYFVEGKVKEEVLNVEMLKEVSAPEAKTPQTSNNRDAEASQYSSMNGAESNMELVDSGVVYTNTHSFDSLDALASIAVEAARLEISQSCSNQPIISDENSKSTHESIKPTIPPEDPTPLLTSMLSVVDPSHPLVKKEVENRPPETHEDDRKRNASSPPPNSRPKNRSRASKKCPETYVSLLQKVCSRKNIIPIYEKLPSQEPHWVNYKVTVGEHSFFTLKDHDSDTAAIEDVAGDAYKYFLSNP